MKIDKKRGRRRIESDFLVHSSGPQIDLLLPLPSPKIHLTGGGGGGGGRRGLCHRIAARIQIAVNVVVLAGGRGRAD